MPIIYEERFIRRHLKKLSDVISVAYCSTKGTINKMPV